MSRPGRPVPVRQPGQVTGSDAATRSPAATGSDELRLAHHARGAGRDQRRRGHNEPVGQEVSRLATVRQPANGKYSVHVTEAAGDRGPGRGYPGPMSSAAAAVPPPGQRSGPSGTAELLCDLSYGSGLAVAERIAHGTNTALRGAGTIAPNNLKAAGTGG